MQLKREILLLKSELKGISELRDKCTALTSEVSSLQKALETKHTHTQASEAIPINALAPNVSYSNIVKQTPNPSSETSANQVPATIAPDKKFDRKFNIGYKGEP